MPVKLGSDLPGDQSEARIEIVPLIDIMFFLLASFMLVSLSMVSLKAIKVKLPTATASDAETKRDFADVSVDKGGEIFLDEKPIRDHELMTALSAQRQAKKDFRVLVSGDRAALYGDVIHALNLIRSSGVENVAFEIQPTTSSAAGKAGGT